MEAIGKGERNITHRLKMKLSIIINILLVILECIGVPYAIASHGSITSSIVYYTQLSNLFLGVVALIYVIFAIRAVRNGEENVPAWLRKLKYYSICCIAVTLFVVIFILAPMASSLGGLRWILFDGSMLYQHTLAPVIAIAGFLLFERKRDLPFRMTFYALIPTLLYAAVLYPLNIAGVVDGPYPFLQVKKLGFALSAMWFCLLLVLSYILALLVWIPNRKLRTQ